MKSKPIVIIGTGGSGRETYALLADIERRNPGTWNFKGFLGLGDPSIETLSRLGTGFLGDPQTLIERIPEARTWSYALGIGRPDHRRVMDAALASQGLQPVSLIHPTALVGPDVEIGPGAVICANAVITTNVRIGISVQANVGCIIAHDVRIGDYVTLAQSVNLAGNVTIENDATIFTNASVIPGVHIGKGATVGAGAVVTSPVPPDTTVAGVPAKTLP